MGEIMRADEQFVAFSPDLVLDTLKELVIVSSASPVDAPRLKNVEARLHEWEVQPGFHRLLTEISIQPTFDFHVRWFSILCLKNGVEKYWRRFAPPLMTNEEKSFIRETLLLRINEPSNELAIQQAVVIGKVARFTYPKEWTALFPKLIEYLKCRDELTARRAILIMHESLKSIASKRLAEDRHSFIVLASGVLEPLCECYKTYFHEFCSTYFSSASDSSAAANALERVHLSLKGLQDILINGLQGIVNSPIFDPLLQALLENMIQVLDQTGHQAVQREEMLTNRLKKFIVLHGKLFLRLQDAYPYAFRPILGPVLKFCYSWCFESTERALGFQLLTVQCFNLLKGVLMSPEYKPPRDIVEVPNERRYECVNTRLGFFTEDRVRTIGKIMINVYFKLTPKDLENWSSDPEEYSKEDAHEAWRFALRPTCERFFQCLFHDYAGPLLSLILQCIPLLQAPLNAENLDQVLERDALWTAIGIPAYHLYEDVDFDALYEEVIVRDMSNMHPNARILRRRAAWVVGEWTGVKFAARLRPSLYERLMRLVAPGEDMVVRLSAATALKKALDDFEFDPKGFIPFCDGVFNGLVHMIRTAEDGDTKMSIVRVLNFLLERMGTHLQKQLDALARYLMLVWGEAEGHNLLRCALLNTFTLSVTCLAIESKALHEFLIPIIAEAVDKNLEAHVYMMEDALELWTAIIHNVSTCSPQLLNLYCLVIPILESAGEYLRPVLVLSLGYLMLCTESYLQTYGEIFQRCVLDLLPDIVREGEVAILRTVETAFRLLPNSAPAFFAPILQKVLVRLVQGGPLVVTSLYLSLLARTLLFKPDLFTALIVDSGMPPEPTGHLILNSWKENLPLVTDMDRRKLIALALLTIVGQGAYPEMFGDVMGCVMQVLYDLRSDEETEISLQMTGLAIGDADPYLAPPSFDSDAFVETEHDKRRRRMLDNDPPLRLSLFAFTRQELVKLRDLVGAEQFRHLMSQMSSEDFVYAKEFGILPAE